ncbi:hypothetical protein GJ496_006605 [Pomphorhynchus laevis]|nr:hypothetical protein GJ496_006605 [Pomphorhynchus laevis]
MTTILNDLDFTEVKTINHVEKLQNLLSNADQVDSQSLKMLLKRYFRNLPASLIPLEILEQFGNDVMFFSNFSDEQLIKLLPRNYRLFFKIPYKCVAIEPLTDRLLKCPIEEITDCYRLVNTMLHSVLYTKFINSKCSIIRWCSALLSVGIVKYPEINEMAVELASNFRILSSIAALLPSLKISLSELVGNNLKRGASNDDSIDVTLTNEWIQL